MGLGQNGAVLSFFEPKRRRFGSAIYFFEIMHIPKRLKRHRFGQNCCKMASFWSSFHIPKTTSFWVSDSCFKTTSFCPKRCRFAIYLKNKIKKKQRRFISSRDKTTSFHHAVCLKTTSPVRRSSLQRAGEGGGGRQGRRPLVGIEDLT